MLTLEPSQVPPAHPFSMLAQAEGSAVAKKISLSLAIVGAFPGANADGFE